MVNTDEREYVKVAIIGGYTLVSPDTVPLIQGYDWFVDRDGYATAFQYNGKCTSIRMHNLLRSRTPELPCIDHTNRVKLDNRLSNLKPVTWLEQCTNKGKAEHNEHTPYTDDQLRIPRLIKTPPASVAYKRLRRNNFIQIKLTV